MLIFTRFKNLPKFIQKILGAEKKEGNSEVTQQNYFVKFLLKLKNKLRNYKPNLQNLKGRKYIKKQNHGNKTKTFLNSHSVQSDSVSSFLCLFLFDSLFCVDSLWDRLCRCKDGNEREKVECKRLRCVGKLLDDASCFFK